MRFLIVTHVLHKSHQNKIWGYGPYIREMNLWERQIDELIVVAPIEYANASPIDLPYTSQTITFYKVPQFNFVGVRAKVRALVFLPLIIWKIFWAMRSADHIHLRCPGNMGLLGSLIQIIFPMKKKTAKYAGNWDPNMKKVQSYNLQRSILSNTFLSRNIKVLVYGEWPGQSSNILPFFTASYHEKEIIDTPPRQLGGLIKCLYCGFLLKEKRPLQTIQVVEELKKIGWNINLTLLGNGPEYSNLQQYIVKKNLGDFIFLKGNVTADDVKRQMQKSHFLTFFGHDSEGWPKVVAESMFWGCVPLVRSVSCTESLLGYGERGIIVKDSVSSMVDAICFYVSNYEVYHSASVNGMNWSRKYTLEYFEQRIKELI